MAMEEVISFGVFPGAVEPRNEPVDVDAGPDQDEGPRSSWVAALVVGDDPAVVARRAGLGLALVVPFSIATGLRTSRPLADAALAALELPVGLALVAFVGVAASTLGVSLASTPLAPRAGASLASRGIFTAGILFAGLSPLVALWVASGRPVEAIVVATLAAFVAGASGIATIARGLVRETVAADGSTRLGALVVSVLFSGFALVVGLRVWIATAVVLFAPLSGGAT